ncbi:MAG: Hpt domain-containing protein [Candidatus Competibacter sp.]|nr:Hpt domain-containing protein [Candidatus Competibacter sp.]MDG4585370.1 Hpt domain-containing protein [Candidatus Competibacter sp.]
MASHPDAANPLGSLKDDLLLALSRIGLNLDMYQDCADLTSLEAIIEAIDQIRGPLAVLEHREAVALLDEMRATVLALMGGTLQSADLATLRQAAEHLTGYLDACLSPGSRRPDDKLVEVTDKLRSIRHSSTPVDDAAEPAADPMEAFTALHAIMDILKRLQQTVATELENTADQPKSWMALQDDLRTLHQVLTERKWTRATAVLGRLNRIVEVLAAGAAEHYGPLVSGVCAEILAGLGHCLEPLSGGGPAPATVLRAAEEQLNQMDTLLNLPALTEALAPAWPTSGRIEPDTGQDAASSPSDLNSNTALAADAGSVSGKHAASTVAGASTGFGALLGLADADPEFIEVFFEEARGELAAVREQLLRWQENLRDSDALAIIRRAFHTLKGSGRMVGATVIGDFAWEYENLLNQILAGKVSASQTIISAIAAAVAALEPLVGETPPRGNELDALPALMARARTLAAADAETETIAAPPSYRVEPVTEPPSYRVEPITAPPSYRVEPITAPPSYRVEPITAPPSYRVEPVTAPPSVRATAPTVDPEFMEVFLEEARGELAAIREHLVLWKRNLADRQALTTLRRVFHNLKGSGRVVGETAVGDLAWCFENLLSHVLNNTVPASLAMADLVDEAASALEPLIGETPVTEEALAVLAALTARADALLQGAPDQQLVSVVAEPAKLTKPVGIEPPVTAMPVEPMKVESPPPAIQPPAPAEPPATEMESGAPPAVDLELAQVFQYEAAEILDAGDAILQRLGSGSEQPGLLNDLRRGMHTLKGSSRMAGFMMVGDLAHAAESVLDALGKGAGDTTPVVLDTLQQTLDRLNRMLAEAGSGLDPAPATDLIGDLHRLAEAVVAGQPVEELPTAAATQEPAAAPEPSALRAMTELDQELAEVFQSEAGEILDSSDALLQQLRGTPDSAELLNNLRREMHTLKGSSRMAGFMAVGDLAHAAESVLDALGKGTGDATPVVLDAVQHALDGLHRMLRGGGEPAPDARSLIDELHGVLGGKPTEPPKPLSAVIAAARAAALAQPTEKPAAAAAAPTDSIRVSAALLNTLANQMGESSIFRARIDQGVNAMRFNLNELEQTIIRLRRQVGHLSTQAEARIQSRQDQGAKAHQLEFDPLELDRFTELQQLSRSLMEIADDLGNVGNALGEHTRDVGSLLDQQGKVNKEIQQGLMRTGMVRFGSIVPRLRRVVRQAAQELGKRAELLVGGEEAEVDRTVLENMIAPLEHMLRNSLAHGIEAPEQRRAVEKSEIGTITLSLHREGAELVLELSDDGAGLNIEAIRAKGEEKGFLLPGQPASQEELIALLLRPGFSTAKAVTQISGRGVGMDVVNAAIRAMRGALLIQTEPGQGSRFIIRLPFSLAVTQALLAKAGDAIFAIPLLSIELVTRIQESVFQAYLTGEPVRHRYNERNYPIHNLGILVGSEHMLPFEEVKDRRPPTLLFRSAEASAALQVEAVMGNQEIIVKPVGPQFNSVPGISGATVLGDGRVVVVLDLAALVRNIGSQQQKQAESRALRMARQEARLEKISIMVIDDSITMRKVTARILERHNIQVVTAKDGLDAVAMLQTQVPDLAILDIEMPRMDGFEVLAHVRNQARLRQLPIIMVTSRGGEKHRERAMKLGVNDYLTKPYQEEQLMQSIRKILGEHTLELIT